MYSPNVNAATLKLNRDIKTQSEFQLNKTLIKQGTPEKVLTMMPVSLKKDITSKGGKFISYKDSVDSNGIILGLYFIETMLMK